MTSNLVQSIFMWHSLIYATLNEIWVKIYLNFTQSYYMSSAVVLSTFMVLFAIFGASQSTFIHGKQHLKWSLFHSKYLFSCTATETKSYRFGIHFLCVLQFRVYSYLEFNVSKSLYLLSLSHICSSQQRLSLMNVSW